MQKKREDAHRADFALVDLQMALYRCRVDGSYVSLRDIADAIAQVFDAAEADVIIRRLKDEGL